MVVIGKVRAGSPAKMLLRGEYSGSPQIVKVPFIFISTVVCIHPEMIFLKSMGGNLPCYVRSYAEVRCQRRLSLIGVLTGVYGLPV